MNTLRAISLLCATITIGLVTGTGTSTRVVLFASPSTADMVSILDYRLPDLPAAADPVVTGNIPNAKLTAAAAQKRPSPPVPNIAPKAPNPVNIPEELDR